MTSDKVTNILKSKSNFTDEEISEMSEGEAWAWVYQNKRPADSRDQICFTGFLPNERKKLWEIAENSGMKIVKSVTKKLAFLCTGENPGPSKLQKANSQKAIIIDKQQFLTMLQTGELPD